MRQARKALARRVMEMQEAGISDEEIQARQRMLQQDVLRSTALALKEHFVLQKVAEDEKIEVDDDEIDLEIERLADQNGRVAAPGARPAGKGRPAGNPGGPAHRAQGARPDPRSAEYEDVPLDAESSLSSVEAQAVEGEMNDPTGAPEEKAEDKTAEGKTAEDKPAGETPS